MTDIELLYQQHIRGLPVKARLQLLALIAQDLAASDSENQQRLSDLKGLGKRNDAQEYIHPLRSE